MIINKIYKETNSVLELSFSIAKANFKTKNEGSLLGTLWYLLDPLLFFAIIMFIRSSFLDTDIEKYPAYLFIGLIIFNFFAISTEQATRIIKSNANLIKSSTVKREVFILSKMLQLIFSHMFEILILLGILIYCGASLWWLFFYPFIFVFFLLFTTGLSFILSILGVYIFDLKNIWPVITRMLWFATPIFYIINNELLEKISILNPVYYFIKITRDTLIHNKLPDTVDLVVIILLGIISFSIGLIFFIKNKDKLAEKI